MALSLTVSADPRGVTPAREVCASAGSRVLTTLHDARTDVPATCGGRGRCTSCRVQFVAGITPPPTIADEVQLGDDQVREGYRLACQCRLADSATIRLAPPLAEESFQILGPGAAPVSASG